MNPGNLAMTILAGLLWLGTGWYSPAGWAEQRGDNQEQAGKDEVRFGQTNTSTSAESTDTKEWLKEQSGKVVPLDAVFSDEHGATVTLGQLIDRPTLLLPVYYLCPTSCSFDLANLADAVRKSTRPPGSYKVISLSFSTAEDTAVAAAAKPNYTNLLPASFPTEAWSFLTGSEDNIQRVTGAIGYTFKKQADGNFIHPSAMAVLDKNGQIIKYVYGAFLPGDVDLALSEAELGKPATSIRRFLSFCFSANPRQNQQVFSLIKLGAMTLLALGALWFILFLRKKRPTPN